MTVQVTYVAIFQYFSCRTHRPVHGTNCILTSFYLLCQCTCKLLSLLGCIECMRCWLLLPMFAVSVRQSVCLSVTQLNCVRCIRATFAKLLWPLVSVSHTTVFGMKFCRVTLIVLFCSRSPLRDSIAFRALSGYL